MSVASATPVPSVVAEAINDFWAAAMAAVPNLIAAIVILVIAAPAIAVVKSITRAALTRSIASDGDVVVDLAGMLLSVVLWFGVLLVVLDVVGMGEIAASLGTAVGFIGLGIAYALSDLVADSVAGVYLLRDPDFNDGDRVTTDSVTGTVVGIGIRKSRLVTDEGDTVVLANRDVDDRWTLETGSPSTDAPAADDAS